LWSDGHARLPALLAAALLGSHVVLAILVLKPEIVLPIAESEWGKPVAQRTEFLFANCWTEHWHRANPQLALAGN
jgi:hypothetical protein